MLAIYNLYNILNLYIILRYKIILKSFVLFCSKTIHENFILFISRAETVTVTKDQSPKVDTTAEALQKLRPAFIKDGTGTVTAGNSSTINDGAACVLLSTLKEAQRLNIQGEPLARIVSWAQVGIDPAIMGTGPIGAVRKAVSFPSITGVSLEM